MKQNSPRAAIAGQESAGGERGGACVITSGSVLNMNSDVKVKSSFDGCRWRGRRAEGGRELHARSCQ